MSLDLMTNFEQICGHAYFIVGLVMTMLFSYLINSYLGKRRDSEKWDLTLGNSIGNETFRRVFRMHHICPERISTLGTLEIIFYYIAINFDQFPLMIAWLSFKVASKWNTWSTIAKIPDHLQDINGFDYLEAKNLVATITLQRWLLGNILNIVGAFASILLSIWLVKLKVFICFIFC